ncbi:hypothetical protein [Campylobacter hyointestinalis]|uniref:Uncharacterized protein n=1 Tax=Campylobacter hyointestinalis subsp. hyointestinalis TaxID=91352 RepID=A0A855N6T8_CAMHY|nr:hypothetical protein [Campylobacter hyointestinalis]PPB54979.1 hypothetical protein CDQ69_02640 [Campylobacter hyointestinalis subsp. hyointestinalis]PPB58609.1 hypothetical protein CDQ70_04650 [Campylobacter hyointestinalis subsp. hyointestinalis]PPB60479.1 hypothetical protein CDQ72_07775 [Campylobacter hyointestinalis subsp. hyointestinalis]PPB61893.1 hypothetical protein CDQ74_07505 [Campylobacter hyointestinalis subsp. hyointestinalis]PPB64865.1 hypothetical protein CDQ73_03270 [Campyl
MLVAFEKELIATIKDLNENTAPYLGEFENKDEMALLIKGGDSFVFVEFVGENYKDMVTKVATYNIHILSTTQSKNKEARLENKLNAIILCERIDLALRNSLLSNEFAIKPNELKVNFNSISDYGYAYVLTRVVQTEFIEKSEFLMEE